MHIIKLYPLLFIYIYMSTQTERIGQVKKAISAIEKAIPWVKIYQLSSDQGALDIMRQPSGSYKVDKILGWGLPEGRIIELFWKESSGKTTLSLIMWASYTREKKFVFFLDAEHSFDRDYAQKLGMDLDYVFVAQPDYGEQGIDILTGIVTSGLFSYAIVDSVSALTPKAMIEGSAEDTAKIAGLARLMSQGLAALTPKIANSKTTVTFINQVRVKIGGFSVGMSVPMDTTGGTALKFYASIRIDVRKAEDIKNKDVKIGQVTKVRTIKNKTFPPFKETSINLMHDPDNNLWGTDVFSEIFDVVVENDILWTRGSYFTLTGEKIKGEDGVPGKERLRQYLYANLGEYKFLEARIMQNNLDPVERVSEQDMSVVGYITPKGEKKNVETPVSENLPEPPEEEEMPNLDEIIQNEMWGTEAYTEALQLLQGWSNLDQKTLVEHMNSKGVKLTWAKAKEVIKRAKEATENTPGLPTAE